VSVAPDEGMQLMAQRFAANRITAEAEPEADPGAAGFTGEFAVFGALAASLGSAAREMRAWRMSAAAAAADWDKVHPIEIPPGTGYNLAGQQNAAGTYDQPDSWQPGGGWAWQIFGWSIAFGVGTTSFSIWYDSPNDPSNIIIGPMATPGRWEPSDFYLMPNRRIVFTSVGGPLIIGKGSGAEIALDYLPRYIGLKGMH